MKIRTLERDAHHELVDVVQLIVDAFIDLPEAHYLIPDPDRRRHVLFAYTMVGARMMWERGATVNIIDDPFRQGPLATAVWLPMPTEDPTQAEREAMNDATAPYIERFEALHHLLHTLVAPTGPDERHRELAWLAVRPDQQNRSMGSALLNHGHADLDQTNTPARLICTTIEGMRLYQRHGYVSLNFGFFGHTPDQVRIMRRPPNPPQAETIWPAGWQAGEHHADRDLAQGNYQRFTSTEARWTPH